MQFQASEIEIRQAQLPHNLFISGLFLFDLLMTPAVIVLNVGMIGLLIPLLCSGALLGAIYRHLVRRCALALIVQEWAMADAGLRRLRAADSACLADQPDGA
jgi:hypothetical protein